MIASAGVLESFREVANQEASIPALHAGLFLLGILAAFAWARRRPTLSLAVLSIAGLLGLMYWLIQIVSPLGFETNPAAARDWAQAGVNAGAEPHGAGFVLGTDARPSLVAALAARGIPFDIVVKAPAIASLLTLGLLILLPFAFLKNRTTAAFAACLMLGGGLWPGIAPYGPILLRPSALLIAGALLGVLLLAAGGRTVRRAFHRSRFAVFAALVAAAAFDRAGSGGAEGGVAAPLFLSVTAVILASPLRAALRKALRSSRSAGRAEACLLLCVFGGSGLLWWDPPRSVPGFNESRNENAALLRPMEWIRRNVPATSVVLASPLYSAPIAAMAGRRVLFSPSVDTRAQASLPEPFRRARLAESTRLGRPLARLAEGFSVTHLFLGPGEAGPPAVADLPGNDEPRMILVPVYQDVKDFRVFRLVKK